MLFYLNKTCCLLLKLVITYYCIDYMNKSGRNLSRLKANWVKANITVYHCFFLRKRKIKLLKVIQSELFIFVLEKNHFQCILLFIYLFIYLLFSYLFCIGKESFCFLFEPSFFLAYSLYIRDTLVLFNSHTCNLIYLLFCF